LEQKSKNKETEAVKGQIPDDEELKRVTLAILGKTSWKELSNKTVRRSMEKELGLGDGALDHRKGVINEWIVDFVNSQEEEE
jgi:rRNA maturation endonuclease Nob1